MAAIHIIGCLGQGMSGLAGLYRGLGHTVTGCDVRRPDGDTTAGILDSRHDHVGPDTDRVVYSVAVKPDHPDLVTADRHGIPAVVRPQALADLIDEVADQVIAVSGVTGKSTTTALVAQIERLIGGDPTIYLGAPVSQAGIRHGELGRDRTAIVEACESGRGMLRIKPTVAVVTSQYWGEHPSSYPTIESLESAFEAFATRTDTTVVPSRERSLIGRISTSPDMRLMTFGGASNADIQLASMMSDRRGFSASYRTPWGAVKVRTRLHGRHNALNLAAAIGTLLAAGRSMDDIAAIDHGLLRAPNRRMQLVRQRFGTDFYDDYGHNPIQIAAVATALRRLHPTGPLGAFFLPSGHQRLHAFGVRYASALSAFDRVFVAPAITGFEDTADTPDERAFATRLVSWLEARGVKSAVRSTDAITVTDFAECAAACFLGANRLEGVLPALLSDHVAAG